MTSPVDSVFCSDSFHSCALSAAYEALADDEKRDREADEWTEGHLPDLDDEALPTSSPSSTSAAWAPPIAADADPPS